MANMMKSLAFIEELPDEVLEDILSMLKTREAAKTCMASRRWRNLYLSLLTWSRNLDLDFTDKKHKFKYIRESMACVLNKHHGDVDNMRIAFHYDKINDPNLEYCLRCSFQEWFMLACGKRVQSLDFHVTSSAPLDFGSVYCEHDDRIDISSSSSWDSLKTLSLKSVLVHASEVMTLLSTCPNLETLLLENIPTRSFCALDSNHKLKRLEILNCMLLGAIYIKSSPNLESLKVIPLTRKNGRTLQLVEDCHAPKLENVILGRPLCRKWMLRLQENVPSLQNLQLDMDVECADYHDGDHDYCWKYDATFPTLVNVKQLELRFTCTREDDHDTRQMDTAIGVIRACPSLEKLTLKYEIHGAETDTGDDDDAVVEDYDLNCFGDNRCLVSVQALGWSGMKSEVRFIRYLIHSSPNLQDMLLDPTPPHQVETSWCGVFGPVEKSKNEIEYAVRVGQQLTDYLHMLAK